MAGPARTAEWRVGVALTPRDRRLISWLQVNYGYIDPIEVRSVNDGLLRLVLNIPAPNAAEAMQWALQILDEAQRRVPRHDRGKERSLVAVECWLADEDPPSPYAVASSR
jgi:hypothetical protein